MQLRVRTWCGIVTLALLTAGAARHAAAQGSSTNAALQNARELLRSQRWDGALQQLGRLKEPGEKAGEVARLEATAWLGKALQADLAATEPMNAVHRSGTLKHAIASLGQQPEHAAFFKQIEGDVTAYLKGASPLAASWPGHFSTVMTGLEKARAAAKRAHELEPAASAGRDEAASLWAWAELCDYLAAREAQQAVIRAETSGILAPELLDAIRRAFPADRQPTVAEPRLRSVLVRLIPEAAGRKSASLSLALAECDLLYSAARQRLRTGRFGAARQRYTSLTRVRLPQRAGGGPEPAALPLPTDPAALLTEKGLEERLTAEPESLLLPLYQLAAADEKSPDAAGAAYGLYFTLLALNEAEAGRLLERLLQRQPRAPALLLERSRYAAVRQEADAAHAALVAAVQSEPLRRPVFLSLPSELRPLLLTSRAATSLAPHFLLTYGPLAGVFTPARPAPGQPHDAVALALQRLRLAELLMNGNLLADVVEGVWRARSALDQLQRQELPEPARAQVEAYRRNLEAATARVAPSLLDPHLKLSTYETQPDGTKKALRTLTISPTGFMGFGNFPPGV